MQSKYRWKLRDVVVLVILAVVCGGIYRIWDAVSLFINISWVPGQGLLNGFWWIASALIPYIIRRPGAAFLAELIAAFVETILGSNWGFSNMSSALFQGIPAELAFAIFAWRKYNGGVVTLSGILAGVGCALQWLVQSGGAAYNTTIIILYFVMTMLSGAIVGGYLPKLLGDALNRAGIVRNFEIGRQTRATQQ